MLCLLLLLNHLQHQVFNNTPPDTVRAPVVVDEEAVRSFSFNPATSKEVLIAALFNVANPVAANVVKSPGYS
jgi:hypothetical protein